MLSELGNRMFCAWLNVMLLHVWPVKYFPIESLKNCRRGGPRHRVTVALAIALDGIMDAVACPPTLSPSPSLLPPSPLPISSPATLAHPCRRHHHHHPQLTCQKDKKGLGLGLTSVETPQFHTMFRWVLNKCQCLWRGPKHFLWYFS
jgi:hypothetical protein